MKINGISFGINAVASGVKSSVVNAEPMLVISSTKGSFSITGSVSKALNVQPGEYIMFANDATDVEKAVLDKVDAVVNFAAENGFDLDTPEGVEACVKAATTWYIAKGVALFKKDGSPVMCSIRLSKEEKQKFYDDNVDEFINENRKMLIDSYNLSDDATDDEIKEHFTVEEMQNPQTQAFSGCKLATTGNLTGVGLKLNFSDTNNWEQLKSDLEDKSAVKRSYKVDVKGGIKSTFNNGKDDVDVVYYPLGEFVDEKPSRVAANKKAETEDAE